MIADVLKVRADGKVIDEKMTFARMRTQGWEPCRVIKVQWFDDGRPIELTHDAGLDANVLPGRRFIAMLVDVDAEGATNSLCIFNSDGTLQHRLPNVQDIRGVAEPGAFSWFEDSDVNSPDVFRVAFELAKNGALYMLDIDAASGVVIAVRQSR